MTAKQTADELTNALTDHDLDKLATRLRHAIDRDIRGGHIQPDGYPRGHADSPGTGARITIEDEEGNPDTIDATSVELTIIAREHHTRDEHHELTRTAIEHAQRAITALDRLHGLLAGIDRLTRPDTTIDGQPPGCSSCSRYLDAVGQPHHSERFRGDLCKWCYGWVNDTDTNPRRRLPPLELIARRARGERITTAHANAALANERTRSRA